MEFRNINELYRRLLPALTTRVNELKIQNIMARFVIVFMTT